MNAVRVLITEDGSSTLFHSGWNDTYHSQTGAVQEAQHVYISHGLKRRLSYPYDGVLRVLEIGFGTGLNAWLTLCHAQQVNIQIHYTAIDVFPLPMEIVQQLNYHQQIKIPHDDQLFMAMHAASWNVPVLIQSNFVLHKMNEDFVSLVLDAKKKFDVVYYDAFGPDKQPDMWTRSVIQKTTEVLSECGVWVTYSAKGQLKRDLKSLGLVVTSLPGAPGKREMVCAEQPCSSLEQSS